MEWVVKILIIIIIIILCIHVFDVCVVRLLSKETGNRDWIIDMGAGYELWRINGTESVIKDMNTDEQKSVFSGNVFSFCSKDGSFILCCERKINDRDTKAEYYIISKLDGTVTGPYDYYEMQDIVNSDKVKWITNTKENGI